MGVCRLRSTFPPIAGLALLIGTLACGDEGTSPPPPPAQNSSPTANISVSATSGSAPVGIALDGRGSTDSDGQIQSWSWNLGDGSSATGEAVEHVYETSGTYDVTLTVTDDDGATDQATQTITVTEPAADEVFGVVWHDADNDGVTDPGETGADGVEVYIDDNGNGQLDGGEMSVVSGIGGIYRFNGMAAGDYDITQRLPIGWTNTAAVVVPVAAPTPAPTSSAVGALTQIIEGDAVGASEFPFQVSLQQAAVSARQASHFCGGTMVAPQWVMTASHCVDFWSSPSDVEVLVGTHDFTLGGSRIAVDSLIVHPFFVGTETSFKRDMALIKLATRMEDIPRTFLVDSTLFSDLVTPFQTATVIGWGRTQEGVPGSVPNAMQKIQIPVLPDSECTSRYGDTFDQTMICAGFVTGGQSACQGDSGGPLLMRFRNRWYEAGIVSWGVGCGAPNRPGVYARVAAMYDFLEEHIAREPSQTVTVTKSSTAARADFRNFR